MIAVRPRPLVVHRVAHSPRKPRSLGAFELRAARPRIGAILLGMSIADLDCVRDARSGADLTDCPDCACEAD